MSEEETRAVDHWLEHVLIGDDPVLRHVQQRADRAGLPMIEVAPTAGKLLQLLVRISGARRVLEIGTLAGYSAIWMARGSDAVRILTIERSPEHAAIARENFVDAGVADRIEVRVGQAVDVLDELVAEPDEPFDLVFIDADKRSNPLYLERAIALGHPGTVVVVDNVVRGGSVLTEPAADDDSTRAADLRGTREVLRLIGEDVRLDGTALQTVGVKGWDGFALAVVR